MPDVRGRPYRWEMTPEERDEERRKDKWHHVARQRGMSDLVPGAPVAEHLDRLRATGMSMNQIGRLAGKPPATIKTVLFNRDMGHLRLVYRDTRDAIMSVQAERPDSRGALVDDTGTRRRLRALMAMGFPAIFMADALEMGSRANLAKLITGTHSSGTVHQATALKVSARYDKYAYADPVDLGVGKHGSTLSRRAAERNGYAPPGCWDSDTIDDPDAIAEWTGACGTPSGWRIHRREDIPACAPCRAAHQEDRRTKYTDRDGETAGPVFDLDAFQRARELKGFSKAGLAVAAGLDPATVQGWEAETRRPTIRTLEKVARVLDATLHDFHREEEQ